MAADSNSLKNLRNSWKLKIKNWQVSGKSGKQWCREHGEAEHLFYYWKKRFFQPINNINSKKATIINFPQSFVELTDKNNATDTGIEIEAHSIKLRLNKDFDTESLTQIFSILKEL